MSSTPVYYLLPIGSVVLLKEGEKRLMITGVKPSAKEGKGRGPFRKTREYDYIGVLYPEGEMGGQEKYLFYHDDIQTVFFRGFEDQERSQFITELTHFYSKGGDSHGRA